MLNSSKMAHASQHPKHHAPGEALSAEVLILGAGISGLYALYETRRRGKSVIAVDSGAGVGGTWYWNRYPGLHVDIESLEYSYAWSEELQQEWSWSERYASQPEVEDYLNFVADKFDLRRDIHLSTRIPRIDWDENASEWVAQSDDGRIFRARYVIMATGLLSAPKEPKFDGLENFQGEVYQTAHWPREGVSFKGKRVGVVGTGASGVQVIPFVAREAAHLNVYQRTPSYAIPLKNRPMDREHERAVKANYPAWREKERFGSFGGWCAVNNEAIDQVMDFAMDQDEETRNAHYESRWESGCLAFYNVYPDVFFDKAANDTLAEFIRDKLRKRINDPELERLLVPQYPVLMRRLCGETGYYETFKEDHVDLVDLNAKPIVGFTEKGIKVGDEEHELDAVVFATGYDAMSGALTRMQITGVDGWTLNEHWSQGIRTAYGMMAAGFPNMFCVSGPGSPAPLFQPVLFCQDQMAWAFDAIHHVEETDGTRISPTVECEEAWQKECDEKFHATLFGEVESWYTGKNVDGKKARGLIYFGGIHPYREFVRHEVDNSFPGFVTA